MHILHRFVHRQCTTLNHDINLKKDISIRFSCPRSYFLMLGGLGHKLGTLKKPNLISLRNLLRDNTHNMTLKVVRNIPQMLSLKIMYQMMETKI
ncbi:unnamed protein product [Prunus brigantina]